MRVPKCPTCGGTGSLKEALNSSFHFDGTDDPMVTTLPCDDCAGTGKDMTFAVHQHSHHTNPYAKER